MHIFFLLDSSIQKLITLVWKGLTVTGRSSPMQTSKFNQGITWLFTNLAKTYEKCCMCFLQKNKNTPNPNQTTYNRRTETIFIFAVTENEIFPCSMIYAFHWACFTEMNK